MPLALRSQALKWERGLRSNPGTAGSFHCELGPPRLRLTTSALPPGNGANGGSWFGYLFCDLRQVTASLNGGGGVVILPKCEALREGGFTGQREKINTSLPNLLRRRHPSLTSDNTASVFNHGTCQWPEVCWVPREHSGNIGKICIITAMRQSSRLPEGMAQRMECFLFFGFFFFLLFRATPTAYGSSRARGLIRATAVGLRHSHSYVGSEPRLRPTPQFMAMPDP